MDSRDIQKGVETLANLSKLAANISTPKQPQNPPQDKKTYKGGDSTNQPHTQTVEVKLGDQSGENKKPIIVKEKTETHIHKHYPDNRALSPEECEVEKLRINMEYAEKDKERAHQILMDDRAAKERERQEELEKIRAEKEREERAEREEKRRKREKRLLIYGAIVGGIGLVGTGYYLYTDSRRSRNLEMALRTKQPTVNIPDVISGEGEVK